MGEDGGLHDDPTDVEETFDALLKHAAHVSAPKPPSRGAALTAGSTLSKGRLSILRRLGEGGMGVVYQAFDAQRRSRVALKTLTRMDAGGVYRLKNEFRALADVTHENLVRLHELFAEDEVWFFTMELVEGERFDAWVRPDDRLDEQRLRDALPQLVMAMSAIHDAGKLHRDLKPANVLVTHDGRVVVLDFGLAVDPELGGVGQTLMDESVSGTPAYMAPEQAAGRPATAASDFYALGVMLFEALTGRLPFDGSVGEMLAQKQTRDAPRTRELAPGLPEDLDVLCAELLAREPSARPGAAALRVRLGSGDASTTASRRSRNAPAALASDAEMPAPELLGREAELAALRDAFAATRDGQPVVLFVSGESGMGKSALCAAFASELRARGPATVLSGRCHERENVPFKGFDALVDDLSRHLRRMSAVESAAVLPREVFALARVFPVLDRIQAIADAPKKEVQDPQDLKRRAFQAFGALLARMRDRTPLVLLLDDVQWLDHDSVRFLRALLVHAEPVPLLLVCAHRSEGAADNALLQAVLQGARDNAKLEVRELRVGPLSHEALRTLAQRLLPQSTSTEAAAVLAREAKGSPFFAAELARAAAVRGAGGATPSLAEALSLHVGALPIGARRVLSLLALAGQPLASDVVVDAASAADGHESLDRLRAEQLVRVSIDATGARSVECYHDQIREHIAAWLEPLHARELALALARALGAVPSQNLELITRMLDLAGLPAEAAGHAAKAAEAAFAALAFERSAQLYTQAIEHGQFGPERLQALRIGRADALAHAGRAEAADAYMSAAEHATDDEVLELEFKAGEHYLLRGDLEHGRARMGRALRRIGYSLPQSLPAALASLAWSRTRLRLRGLTFVPRAQHDPRTLRELELLRLAVHALVRSDFVRAADFSARSVCRALEAGHEVELARALTWEILLRSFMHAPDAQVQAAMTLCSELCERTGDARATMHFLYCRGIHTVMRVGQPDAALRDFDRQLALSSATSFPTTGYDRAWVEYWRANCMFVLGRVTEAGELAIAALEDAIARGDHTVSGSLVTISGYGLLARGRVAQLERLLEEARARLRLREVTLPDMLWLSIRLATGTYAGRAVEAWRDTAEHRERYFRSASARMTLFDSMCLLAAGAAAEAARETPDPGLRRELLREARKLIRRTRSDAPATMWVPAGALLACLNGDRERAISELRDSLPRSGPPLVEQLRRRRLGELVGGNEGTALIASADAFLRQGGVLDPARYTAAFMAGLTPLTER